MPLLLLLLATVFTVGHSVVFTPLRSASGFMKSFMLLGGRGEGLPSHCRKGLRCEASTHSSSEPACKHFYVSLYPCWLPFRLKVNTLINNFSCKSFHRRNFTYSHFHPCCRPAPSWLFRVDLLLWDPPADDRGEMSTIYFSIAPSVHINFGS